MIQEFSTQTMLDGALVESLKPSVKTSYVTSIRRTQGHELGHACYQEGLIQFGERKSKTRIGIEDTILSAKAFVVPPQYADAVDFLCKAAMDPRNIDLWEATQNYRRVRAMYPLTPG